MCVYVVPNIFLRWHLTAQGKCSSLTSTTAFVSRTANSRGTKQNRKQQTNRMWWPQLHSANLCSPKYPSDFHTFPTWHKTRSTPNTPTESGIYFCLRAYEIDSYASAPDLKRSEGLRVHIVPLLCTEGEKKKRGRWWWLDWTHSNWWVPWPEAWERMCFYVCACVCTLSFKCTLILCRLNHCNGALMPEELNGRGHSQKMAP